VPSHEEGNKRGFERCNKHDKT